MNSEHQLPTSNSHPVSPSTVVPRKKNRPDGCISLRCDKDNDLRDMLGVSHPLHRRRVCLGIQKIKDKEEEEVGRTIIIHQNYQAKKEREKKRRLVPT